MTVPAVPAAPAAPVPAPVIQASDNLGRSAPVYAGADPAPAAAPASTPEERGDVLVVATAPVVPAAVVADPAAPAVVPDPNPIAPVVPAAVVADPAAPVVDPAAPVVPARDEKGKFIPKERFDEVNNRRKAAEDELAALKATKDAATAAAANKFDFDAAEKEYMNLVIDGKTDEAVAKRGEIRAAEQSMYETVAVARASEVTQATSTRQSVEQVVADYEARLPDVFKADGVRYSEAMMDDVQSLYAGHLQTGRYADQPTAFKAAIESALKIHGISVTAPAAVVADPAVPVVPAAVPAAVTPKPGSTAAPRIAAVVGQPPLTGTAGVSSASAGADNLNVGAMTDAEFAALPAATKARLRGDTV